MQNEGYYGVQGQSSLGHRGQYQPKARMRLPIGDYDILSRTVSELSQFILQI